MLDNELYTILLYSNVFTLFLLKFLIGLFFIIGFFFLIDHNIYYIKIFKFLMHFLFSIICFILMNDFFFDIQAQPEDLIYVLNPTEDTAKKIENGELPDESFYRIIVPEFHPRLPSKYLVKKQQEPVVLVTTFSLVFLGLIIYDI